MSSEKDHSFIATGPREGDTNPKFTAFNTGAAPLPRFFDYGVNVQGKQCGVFASTEMGADRFPRNARTPVGVYALGGPVGIYGEALDNGGFGVQGRTDGIRGVGGHFSSKQGPQLHLEPSPTAKRPPRTGTAGDLLVITDSNGAARLWFCTHGQGAASACWRRVAFDKTFGSCPEIV